ncbi:MAG: glycine dehydrogenase (aminomethyl-transferring) [Candidatus Melainabacteria bacterium RIFCSPHIGHO2_02_FULL_34_12]|nr:MAG: glycine dehydrogenase (aminomethyl-transferring) [Candidatus Melainabacteria bacterium RIFCSPHIGHO2_02_FULL_34_12]
MSKLIFEKSKPGRICANVPQAENEPSKPILDLIPENYIRREKLNLPEVSELELIRHFSELASKNFSIDKGFYPLGSCTMKYNPKINELVSRFERLSNLHPLQPEDQVQGALEIMFILSEYLKEISGFKAITLQPAAGAHGELTGLLMIKKYFEKKGDKKRTKVLVPDTAHGTNPATASMCNFTVVELKSNNKGQVDLDSLKSNLDETTAAIMLTNPNTLGIFEEDILTITKLVHQAGALQYYDGANLNAIMGIARPGDMGFDVCHLNLHKTFSTPHGGGGPGAGVVCCNEKLEPCLPIPILSKSKDGVFYWDYDRKDSIGKVKGYYGNFGMFVRALAYIWANGKEGLNQVSKDAVLNANYMKENLKKDYDLPYDIDCMHEFVLSGKRQKKHGVSTLAIAKRLLDFGVHSPTVYFPLVVQEAIMIEPTETESKEELDRFIEIMKQVAAEAISNPELVNGAPYNTPVGRVDEAHAARSLNLCWASSCK